MSGVNWAHVWGQLGSCLGSTRVMSGVNRAHVWGQLGSCLGSIGIMPGVMPGVN